MPLPTSQFTVHKFLAKSGEGRKIVRLRKKDRVYAQAKTCDALFYIKKGKIKLTSLSTAGNEATIAILNPTDFFGEGCLAAQTLRMGSAIALTDCEIMRIDNNALFKRRHRQHGGVYVK